MTEITKEEINEAIKDVKILPKPLARWTEAVESLEDSILKLDIQEKLARGSLIVAQEYLEKEKLKNEKLK